MSNIIINFIKNRNIKLACIIMSLIMFQCCTKSGTKNITKYHQNLILGYIRTQTQGQEIPSDVTKIINLYYEIPYEHFEKLYVKDQQYWGDEVTYSPNGKIIAGIDYQNLGANPIKIKLWYISSSLKPFKTLEGHTDDIYGIKFSPNGKILASGSRDGTTRLWCTDTWKCFKILKYNSYLIRAIDFSRDGKTLAVGDNKTIILWDTDDWCKCSNTLSGYNTGLIYSVKFSPDGRTLAVCDNKTIILWVCDTSSWNYFKTLEHTCRVHSMDFSPDGKILACGYEDGAIKFWDTSSWQCFKILKGGHTKNVLSLNFSPNGSTLASGGVDKKIILWDTNSWKDIKTFTDHENTITHVEFSPNGTSLISSGCLQPFTLRGVQKLHEYIYNISGKKETYTIKNLWGLKN